MVEQESDLKTPQSQFIFLKKKKMMIVNSVGHELAHHGAVTPAVILDCRLPSDMGDSMVQGDVTVNVYDSVFCGSTGWRHAVQLILVLLRR